MKKMTAKQAKYFGKGKKMGKGWNNTARSARCSSSRNPRR
jgi:hypothetical protein